MLDWFRGYNMIIREWGNGVVYPLCACLLVVIVCFLIRTYLEDPRGWREKKGVETAHIFFGMFLAEGLRAISAWVPLAAANEGRKLSPFLEDVVSFGFTLGVGLMVLILLRSMWVFSPIERKEFTLSAAVAATVITLAVMNVIN